MKIDNIHKCPYCGFTYQAVLGQNVFSHLASDPGSRIALHTVIYVCPHIVCRKVELFAEAGGCPPGQAERPEAERNQIRQELPHAFFKRRLMPSEAIGKSEFETNEIPQAIFADYDLACRLLDISPCASATYARRCIQSMIRSKFKVKPGKLLNEIKALGTLPTPVHQEVIEVLDYVRKLGKFKALPDDDVRVVASITYEEAKQIIEIIEILFLDWFIAPTEHNLRLAELKSIFEKKSA